MNVSEVFSTLAGVFIFAGYIVYDKEIFLGRCKPNVISWSLWTMTTVLNLASYLAMTGDIFKASLSIVSSFFCLLTLIFALAKREYKPLQIFEWLTLVIGVLAVFVWWRYQSSLYANMIVQFAIVVAFMPTYRSIWNNPTNECVFPWLIFTVAYMLLVGTVLSRWNGQPEDLVYPILGSALHLLVVILIIARGAFIKQKCRLTRRINF